MKHYNYPQPTIYNVTILIHYFQGQRDKLPYLSFLYWGVVGSRCRKFVEPATWYVNKVLLGLPSLRLSVLSSSSNIKIISVIFANLSILIVRESSSKFVSMNFLSTNVGAPFELFCKIAVLQWVFSWENRSSLCLACKIKYICWDTF